MNSSNTNSDHQWVTDRAAIVEVTNQMLRSADLQEWDAVRACFTESVDADYSSIGGVDETLPSTDLVSQWEGSLGSLDATHHLIASHIVEFNEDETEATCVATFQAQHVFTEQDGSDTHWLLGGRYSFDLENTDDGWQISGITMTAVWDEGDDTIFEKATAGDGAA